MKYTIVLCLLLVFINSKTEFNKRFSLTKGLINNKYNSGLEETTCKANNKDSCKKLPAPEDDEICCYVENKLDGKTITEGCTDFPKEAEKYGDVYDMKEFKAMNKETIAYELYNSEDPYDEIPKDKKIESKVTCKNGGYSVAFENKFSEKEISILKNKNHCLTIHQNKEDDIDYDVGKCEDYLLLDSTKSAGVDCGYFEVKITTKTKGVIDVKSCYLFNLKFIKKMADIDLDQVFDENDIKNILYKKEIYDGYESFVAEAYNGKGKKITYDSKTKNITVEGSGFMLTASKYLFLLMLILF